ncbi:sigma-70 family RNA polymerase sigma factor [Aureimonas sp. ME7]|uniref:sigma-70 family RNA polymerase sigma factor n=1 Tax=Aureimonas sp. ME7 TaxID=2744252 RepID=UPI0015F46A8A|nr:sigma-70 family RNA polymerase sigma factor [Aureimonas sp. ME7]
MRLDHWLADLYRRHHRELVRYTTRLVGDRSDGEDVAQNAYLRLAARQAETAIERPRNYLFTAARTAAFDFSARQHAEWLTRVDWEDAAERVAGEDPAEAFERRERILRLALVLNELPNSCRTAFVLNKIEGLTHREIAGRLGISVSMVEKHIMRALVHCRDVARDEARSSTSR